MKRVFVLIAISLLFGCAGPDVTQIRSGRLSMGLHASAFERAWGLPTKTYVCPGGDIETRNYMTGNVSKKTADLECWEYTDFDVLLRFYENNLASWKTDKTVEQIRKLSVKEK